MPPDARYILECVEGVDGFYGASSMERLPTEVAITDQVKQFTKLKLPSSAGRGWLVPYKTVAPNLRCSALGKLNI